MEQKNIYVFYHICLLNDWARVFSGQLNKIIDSGLLKIAQKLYLSVVGDKAEEIAPLLAFHEKIQIVYTNNEPTVYEMPTLDILHRHCISNPKPKNSAVLYIHTKGVSYEALSQQKQYIENWRNYLEYFNIDQYQVCLKYLENHDLCGVNWQQHQGIGHFNGNFWWANTEYIKKLPNISQAPIMNNEERFKAESWIGLSSTKKVACLWESNTDHYTTAYPPEKYTAQGLKENIFTYN
jgi:hypothetical protein